MSEGPELVRNLGSKDALLRGILRRSDQTSEKGLLGSPVNSDVGSISG